MTYRRKAGNTKRRAKVASAKVGKKSGKFKAARSYYAIAHCAKHDKFLYSSRAKARAAIRMHHEPGMREYRCDIQPDHWHVGHLPKPVRRGKTTVSAYYQPQLSPSEEQDMTTQDVVWTSENGRGPLTRQVTPLDIRPLNGKASDKPIDVLLAEAEASDDPRIREMAKAIRAQVAQLRTDLKVSQAERELMAKIENMRAELDDAMRKLQELRGAHAAPPTNVTPAFHAAARAAATNQRAIRQWCADQDPPVPCTARGSIPAEARAIYNAAHGIPND